MVTRGNKDALSFALLQEINNRLEGSIVLKNLVDVGGGVVVVSGMVDTATLDHEEETLVAVLSGLLEGTDGGRCHLVEARIDTVHVSAVDLEGNIAAGKETHKGEGNVLTAIETVKAEPVINVVPAVLLLCASDEIIVIKAAATIGRVGQEVAASTSEHEVNDSAKGTVTDLLGGNIIVHSTNDDMASEARRGSIGDVGGDNKTGSIAGAFGSLEHGAAGLVVRREDRDGAIVALLAAGEGSSSSSAVSNERVRRPSAAAAPEMLVENQGVVAGQPVDVLAEAASQRQRSRTHTVGNHENEVPLSREAWACGGRGVTPVLGPDGEDDSGGSGNQSPEEENDLPHFQAPA